MSLFVFICLYFCIRICIVKTILCFWEAAFKRKAVRPEVRLQLRLCVVVFCFGMLDLCRCNFALLKFLVSNHMFFSLSGDSLCEIAFVVERGSQFYLGAMSDALGHIRIVLVVLFLLFFASVFGGFSFGRVLSF